MGDKDVACDGWGGGGIGLVVGLNAVAWCHLMGGGVATDG